MVRAVWTLGIAFATACGSSEPPNCETAIRSAVGRVPGDDKPDEAESAQLVGQCITDRWTATVRSCVGKASKAEQVVACISGREVTDGDLSQRRSEAELNLNAIGKSAKTHYVEMAEFPRATAELPPATSCCASPKKRCPAARSDWHGVPAWDMLDFEISEDHLFRYSYKSDGKTFEARAVGDLDCDGTTMTYVLRGTSDGGNPAVTVIKPSNPD